MKKDRSTMKDRISASDEGLKYLQRRRRTEWEMRKHLAAKGYDEIEIDAAIEYLLSFRYIDDFVYALDYIEMSIGKGRGNMRIRRDLSDKGIDENKYFTANIKNKVTGKTITGIKVFLKVFTGKNYKT